VPRFFNTAGPCNPDDHYMLPVLDRLPDVRRFIDQKLYFVLHAPRQVGKTTSLLTLARELTAEGTYVAVLLSMETGAPFSSDPGAAEAAILSTWRARVLARLPAELQPPPWPAAEPGSRMGRALAAWAAAAPRPLVMFLDEIDALRDDALISILRQIRDGYFDRPARFPWSLALIGLRDVRDYKIASGGREHLGTSSPFNIKVESITLRNFTCAEVAALYAQHTAETGQPFLPDAVALAPRAAHQGDHRADAGGHSPGRAAHGRHPLRHRSWPCPHDGAGGPRHRQPDLSGDHRPRSHPLQPRRAPHRKVIVVRA
jgi:hypothetical protein